MLCDYSLERSLVNLVVVVVQKSHGGLFTTQFRIIESNKMRIVPARKLTVKQRPQTNWQSDCRRTTLVFQNYFLYISLLL